MSADTEIAEGKPGGVVVIEETDAYKVVRTFAVGSYTTYVEWKQGREPKADSTLTDARAALDKATTVEEVKAAVLDLIDHLEVTR